MKLLLAEDERGLARALTAILRHDAYEVDVAEDGNSALTSMLEGSYDAAIIDIMMPGLDGLSVLQRVRAAGARTPVILLTARSEVDDKVEGLDAGANDYLTKPFSAKELLARIRVLTRATTALDARTLAFGDIRLDLASCRLTGPQGSVDLTRREFALMRLLMAHPGVRYPTERLLTGVWGDGADEDLSVVWVHLSNLRKRLWEIGSTVSIRSVRNLGYSPAARRCGRCAVRRNSPFISRLHRVFIGGAMLVGALILTLIVAGTNIVSCVDLCSQADATTVCLLLDCAHDMDRFHSYLGTSIAAAVLGLIAVFAFVALLARIVLRPVVESCEKQRRFVTDASHEIKTPLAVIDAADEVLEIGGGQNEWTQSIHHEVARLAALTEQLVVLSRLDEGGSRLEMRPFDISEAATEAAGPYLSYAFLMAG